jgi:hypothetical protein
MLIPIKRKVSGSNSTPETMEWEVIGHTSVDDKHYPNLIQYNWTYGKNDYVKRSEWDGPKKHMKVVYIQNDIWERLEGLPPTRLDHIDRDKLNNQLSNFRPANNSENGANRGLFVNNTSGFKGVQWNKPKRRFRAVIKVEGKAWYLGHTHTALEAAKLYDAAAIEYFGEFAVTNKSLGLY